MFKPQTYFSSPDGQYSVVINTEGEYFEVGKLCDNIQPQNSLCKEKDLKLKVQLVSLVSEIVFVVLEDNTVWYKGTSKDDHLP